MTPTFARDAARRYSPVASSPPTLTTSSSTPGSTPSAAASPSTLPSSPLPTTPVSLNRFVGRDRELEELSALLPSTRLLTLTGAGGSGKTRLASEITARIAAVQAAEGVERLKQQVWIDLASLQEPSRIVPQLAMALGVSERPDQSTLANLTSIIGVERMLVVLDNCEHLVDACAGVAEALLQSCPRLTILATSREALGVPGEIAWLVPPMQLDEAVQLFVERARSVQPAFALSALNAESVQEVCERLDGIPLAVELAAARVRVLTPVQIASRLSDAFKLLSGGSRTAMARHRTLRGAIDWSYGLLGDREQTLLQRLTVFAGSFSIDAVEEICADAQLDSDELLDALSALVEKSLVALDASGNMARYKMLETVRQYGDELLRAAGASELLRERHARYYLAFCESAAPRMFGGSGDPELVERMIAESGNVRAAMAWASETSARTETSLRFGYALHWFWFSQGQFDEGHRRLSAALASQSTVPAITRARALIALGHINLWQSRLADVAPHMNEALTLLRGTDERLALAYALNGVGLSRYVQGDFGGAATFLDEALSVVDAYPDHVLGAIIRYWRGLVFVDAGDHGAAADAFAFATALGRRIRHRPAMGHPLLMSGRLALVQGTHAQAFALFAEAFGILHDLRDQWGSAQGLEGIACAVAGLGEPERAAQLLGAASVVRRRLGTPWLPSERALMDVVIESLRAALGDAFDAAWSAGEALTRESALELALRVPAAAVQRETTSAPTVVRPAPATPVREVVAITPSHADESIGAASLSVRALGPLNVTVDGERVDAAAWGSARSRELLVFLLCHPNGCTKEQVGAALWPDASPAQVRNAFHVTLHRLRKALRHAEWVMVKGDRYVLDPAVATEFDAGQFERDMSAALRRVTRKDPAAADAIDEALALYGGDFLDGESVGDWPIPWHDRLQRLFLDGLRAVATMRLAQGRFADAALASRRLLASDSLDEDAWRTLMLCHARQGERPQALRLYQQLSELIERELESEPDSATTRLFEQIQRGATV